MKLIKPSWEIIPQVNTLTGIYKQIEIAGRHCYKSEGKITKTSAKEFVERMIKSKHDSMLEHGTVYLYIFEAHEMPDTMHRPINPLIHKYYNNKYTIGCCVDEGEWVTHHYITTNYRVLVENGWLKDLQYLCSPTEFHEKRTTVKFICDRGISHEFVRHRVFSFAQESTRYVASSIKRSIQEFNCDSEFDICKAYEQGFSMREISIYSSQTEWGIRKILLKHNIEIRGLNNKGNRVEDYFSNIDTPEKAYLLGIIQSDGNITIQPKKSSLSITQHKDYYWYIKNMLLDFSDKIGESKDRNCINLQIGSKQIVNDLINIGIIPNKTYDQSNENIESLWNNIPDNLKNDFIRGLIDGDGHITYFIQNRGVNESCHIGLCSTQEYLIDLIIEYIFMNFNYNCGKGKDGNVYKLWITDYKKSIEIGKALYNNFKYPFGHPKKASNWIKRLNITPDIAEYKDTKFKIIKPLWLMDSNPEQIFMFIKTLDVSEDVYTKLRLGGWQPQQARAVLPNSLKTELVMTGFDSDWEHFFQLRTALTAHPQARELTIPLQKEMNKGGVEPLK